MPLACHIYVPCSCSQCASSSWQQKKVGNHISAVSVMNHDDLHYIHSGITSFSLPSLIQLSVMPVHIFFATVIKLHLLEYAGWSYGACCLAQVFCILHKSVGYYSPTSSHTVKSSWQSFTVKCQQCGQQQFELVIIKFSFASLYYQT